MQCLNGFLLDDADTSQYQVLLLHGEAEQSDSEHVPSTCQRVHAWMSALSLATERAEDRQH